VPPIADVAASKSGRLTLELPPCKTGPRLGFLDLDLP